MLFLLIISAVLLIMAGLVIYYVIEARKLPKTKRHVNKPDYF